MEIKRGAIWMFTCPVCQTDTPHTVRGNHGDVYGVICNHCHTGSLVREDHLTLYQAQWEEELRQILDSLNHWPGEDHDGHSST
ncbi:MAG: hypothetical protein IMX01_02215 [Limnochordaceae bacterium]|nr:hypothetical protein [Limnochordaceae bacterium]